jgi:hypothetical protein
MGQARRPEVANRDVFRELMRRLADDCHVGEVVEDLEEADSAVEKNRAMRPRRAREPALELAVPLTGHGLSLLSHWVMVDRPSSTPALQANSPGPRGQRLLGPTAAHPKRQQQAREALASPSCRSNVGYGTIRIEGWFVAARRVRMRRDELGVELDAKPRSDGQQRPALVDCQPIPLNFLA